MKICPKCNITHNKSGTFCSRKCANSRTWTEKDKLKKSVANKTSIKFWNVIHSPEYKEKTKASIQKRKQTGTYKYTFNREANLRGHKTRKENIRKKAKDVSLETYRNLCEFSFGIKNYPDEFDFSLIEKYGWYSPKNKRNNLGGISRDHIVSVKYGFDHKIDPEIISHPANCQLLIHNKNISKHKKCGTSYEELLSKIAIWNKKYGEYNEEIN